MMKSLRTLNLPLIALITLAFLLIAAAATQPLFAADPPKPQAPTAPYPLQGDATNPTGSADTNFVSTGNWNFTSNGVSATTLKAVTAACPNGSNCWGMYGLGTSVGVYGETPAGTVANTFGVFGLSSDTAASGSSYGVYGSATNTATGGKSVGVRGDGDTYGVYGKTDAGYGVLGASNTSYGVRASSTSSYGLLATSTNSVGVRGTSQTYYGFYAGSTSGTGGYAYTASGSSAFRAHNDTTSAGHYGIISDGDVMINGNLICTGSCSAAFSSKTAAGDKLIYAESAAQNLVSDVGTATIKDGRAVIKIDALFAQTVNLAAGYQVFVTPRSAETAGLAVVNHSRTSFEVRELNKGHGTFDFDWRITALRAGYEQTRMAAAPAVPVDTKLDSSGESFQSADISNSAGAADLPTAQPQPTGHK